MKLLANKLSEIVGLENLENTLYKVSDAVVTEDEKLDLQLAS